MELEETERERGRERKECYMLGKGERISPLFIKSKLSITLDMMNSTQYLRSAQSSVFSHHLTHAMELDSRVCVRSCVHLYALYAPY